MIKRIFSVLIAIVMLFGTFSVSVFAEDCVVNKYETNSAEQQFMSEDNEEYVATMYLCATANSFTGHVWLYFENLTDGDLRLGYVTMMPHEGMSVGSLGVLHRDGAGVYYNSEVMMGTLDHNLDKVQRHTYSLKMNLTKEQFEKVSEKIKSHNFYELIVWNCGSFATTVWNSVSKKKIVHIIFPALTVLNMIIHGAEHGTLRMKESSIDRAFKQRKGYAEPAHTASFVWSCIG